MISVTAKRKQGRLLDHVEPGIEPFPGAVVIAAVRAPKKAEETGDPKFAETKPRPAVLKGMMPARSYVDQHGERVVRPAGWATWGLTSLGSFADGSHRMPASGLQSIGLAAGYCWGGNVVVLPEEDVLGVVWAAPPELILACAAAERSTTVGQAQALASALSVPILDAGWYWPKWAD